VEDVMHRFVFCLSLVLLLSDSVASHAQTPREEGFVAPEGTFVLDGGDAEAAGLMEGFCAAPSLVGTGRIQPSGDTSLTASARALFTASADPQAPVQPRPMAFEYSDGYRTRLKIHKYASFATLPLFVAQYAVGQKLYNGNASDGTRSAHTALAAGTAVLFGVNTVTGVWNLTESRKDPSHRTKRTVHGILMLVADAGFVATGMLAPESEGGGEGGEGGEGGGNRSTHRSVALASMGVATVAYLIMLFGH
jgi:hypothetical protein